MENTRLLLFFVLFFAATRMFGQQGRPSPKGGLDIEAASRFARLALDCVHKEYPNKISHSMNSDSEGVKPKACVTGLSMTITG